MANNYWQKRSEEIAQLQFDKADLFEEEIAKEYKKSLQYIEDKINSYYARYSKDYGVSYADAQKLLTTSELDNFHMSLDEFIEKAKHNEDGQWSRLLDKEYLKSRISRLEALNTQITSKLIELGHIQENKAIDTLSNVFSDTYYRTAFAFEQDIGMATNFAMLSGETTNTAIYSKWLNGKNFSDRLWDDKSTLINNMSKIIRQGLIVGSSTDEMARNLTKTMNVSLNRAKTLIQTETAYIHEKATTKVYKEFGVNEYEVAETLDSKTCDVCGSMDGQRFKLSEKEEGVTAPPFHPRCRGTTVPVTANDDLFNEDSTRIARDDEENTIEVPTNMNYNEWHKKYVENKVEIPYINNLISTFCDLKIANKEVIQFLEENIRDGELVIDYNNHKVMYYDLNTGKIVVNPKHKNFQYYDIITSLIHETAHKIDDENGISIKLMKSINDKFNLCYQSFNIPYYNKLIKGHEYNMSISDIFSALTNTKVSGYYAHTKTYWSKSGKVEQEIIANMMTIYVTNDIEAIKILNNIGPLKELFEEVINVYKNKSI